MRKTLLPNPNAPVAVSKAFGSKTLLQQNPPVLNWECRLTQVDLYSSRKTVVVVIHVIHEVIGNVVCLQSIAVQYIV